MAPPDTRPEGRRWARRLASAHERKISKVQHENQVSVHRLILVLRSYYWWPRREHVDIGVNIAASTAPDKPRPDKTVSDHQDGRDVA